MEFIKIYFSGEKSGSLIFMLIGIVAIVTATYMFVRFEDGFHKGFAVPLIVIGLIQLAVGGTVYFRTDAQVGTLIKGHENDRASFVKNESARMEVVMRNFKVIKWVEIVFILVGLILVVWQQGKGFWFGFGTGILLQGALMLTADVFAERRGKAYTEKISGIALLSAP